jgi:hypothetical protein
MGKVLQLIGAVNILFPAIAGIFLFRKIQKEYKPFIYVVWLGVLMESTLLITPSEEIWAYFNYTKHNIYQLFEFVLYLWFFKNILKDKKPIWFLILLSVGILVWLYENILLAKLGSDYSFYFSIGYSFTLAFLAIDVINMVLLKHNIILLKNSLFLIACAVVVFFVYQILVEVFTHFSTVNNKHFFRAVFSILQWINIFTNIVFGIAILWIPKTKNFSSTFL